MTKNTPELENICVADLERTNEVKTNRNKKIYCEWHSSDRREFYVDENMKVLPCCYYAVGLKNIPDPVFLDYEKQNPGWNDLSLYTMDEIINSEIYQNHIWTTGWEKSPSELCIANCGWKYRSPDEFEKSPDDPDANS